MYAFTKITNDGDRITSKMPVDETEVEVLMTDGSIVRAVYSSNIMEAGDWDFVPVDNLEGDSIADRVEAWRTIPPIQPKKP